MSDRLVIVGAGGHASNVMGIALALEYDVVGFIHDKRAGQRLFDRPIFGDLEDVVEPEGLRAAVAVGDNFLRETYAKDLIRRVPDVEFPPLIHPMASVHPYATIGAGSVVLPFAVVGANTAVGAFCIVGAQSCLAHDSQLGDYSSVGTASVVAGSVVVGTRSVIGMGSTVREKVRVGDNTVLGAASFLNSDLPSNVVAFGSPARIQAERGASDAYYR